MKKDLVIEDLEKAKIDLEKDEDLLAPETPNNFNSKKVKTFFLASFLILLMLSFLYLSSPVYSFILGLAGSSKLDGSNVIFENSVIVSFDANTLGFLQDLYNPLGDEHAVCLLGDVVDGKYVVTDYYVPLISDHDWNFVSHAPCNDDAIIMLHTHPFKRCEPSQTDRNTLKMTQLRNDKMLMLVMCSKNRFSAVI